MGLLKAEGEKKGRYYTVGPDLEALAQPRRYAADQIRDPFEEDRPLSLPFEGLSNDSTMIPASDVEAELERHWADDLDRSRR